MLKTSLVRGEVAIDQIGRNDHNTGTSSSCSNRKSNAIFEADAKLSIFYSWSYVKKSVCVPVLQKGSKDLETRNKLVQMIELANEGRISAPKLFTFSLLSHSDDVRGSFFSSFR